MSSKLESDVCCRLQVAPPGERYGGNRRPAESNGSLLLSKWRDSLHVTCGLTACTPGSAPGPTLGNEYGKTLPLLLREGKGGRTEERAREGTGPTSEARGGEGGKKRRGSAPKPKNQTSPMCAIPRHPHPSVSSSCSSMPNDY